MKSDTDARKTPLMGSNGHDTVPGGLSPEAARLWEVFRPRAKSPGRKLLLREMLLAWDRGTEISRLLAEQGLVTKTPGTGVMHVSPLLKAEREARVLVARIAGLLALDWCHDIDGGR